MMCQCCTLRVHPPWPFPTFRCRCCLFVPFLFIVPCAPRPRFGVGVSVSYMCIHHPCLFPTFRCRGCLFIPFVFVAPPCTSPMFRSVSRSVRWPFHSLRFLPFFPPKNCRRHATCSTGFSTLSCPPHPCFCLSSVWCDCAFLCRSAARSLISCVLICPL